MFRRLLPAVAALAAILGLVSLVPSSAVTRPAPHRTVAGVDTQLPGGIEIDGLDLHDGQIIQVGATFYFYGTQYGCGYSWYTPGTPWCGFGVATSTDLTTWSPIITLFTPGSSAAAGNWSNRAGHDWQYVCGGTGQGCFNPRMVVNAQGTPVLWFNAPRDYTDYSINAYYAMGCNSLTGPCGAPAGAPHGSTTKPAMTYAAGNGDFSLMQDATGTWLIGTEAGTAGLSVEKLNYWANGGATGVGVNNLAGVSNVEGPGMFKGADGAYYATYSDPAGGYIAGDQIGYATAPAPAGPWTSPVNVGINPPVNGRRVFSSACGGQPRSVATLNGVTYELIDLWTGARNETTAGTYLAPLVTRPASGAPGDGHVWRAPLQPFTCE